MRRSILLLFSLGVIAAGATAGELRTDIFGNVYDGDWSIPVGQVEPGGEGRLRVDVFGDIYVEDRPFPVGHTDHPTGEGWLHMDSFGGVRAGDSLFEIEDADKVLKLKR